MKKAAVLCALVGVAVYATTAWSASTTDPTVARLQRDVATLKSQTKTLQSQVKNLQKDDKAAKSAVNTLGELAATVLVVNVCSDEIAADELQGTWQVIDQISATLQAGKTYFGPQTPVTATLGGQDVCSVLNVTRATSTTGVPPSVAPYLALLAPFHSSSSALHFAAALRLVQKLHLK